MFDESRSETVCSILSFWPAIADAGIEPLTAGLNADCGVVADGGGGGGGAGGGGGDGDSTSTANDSAAVIPSEPNPRTEMCAVPAAPVVIVNVLPWTETFATLLESLETMKNSLVFVTLLMRIKLAGVTAAPVV